MTKQAELKTSTYAQLVIDDTRALERTVKEIVDSVNLPLFLSREGYVGIPNGPVIGYREFGGRVQVEICQNGGDPAKTSYFFDRLNSNLNRDGT